MSRDDGLPTVRTRFRFGFVLPSPSLIAAIMLPPSPSPSPLSFSYFLVLGSASLSISCGVFVCFAHESGGFSTVSNHPDALTLSPLRLHGFQLPRSTEAPGSSSRYGMCCSYASHCMILGPWHHTPSTSATCGPAIPYHALLLAVFPCHTMVCLSWHGLEPRRHLL